MPPAVVVFTRDLRIHDHPALHAALGAAGGGPVVPLFVFDDDILASAFNRPNRSQFLLESLADLDGSLRARGGRLVTRRGEWVTEVLRVAATAGAATIHVGDDVSPFSGRRVDQLADAAVEAGDGRAPPRRDDRRAGIAAPRRG